MIARPDSSHPLIRKLGEKDLDRVFEIEISAYPYPWTRGIFSDCLRAGYDCWGLQADSELIGYCIQSHAANECHLLNLCIAPAWQRRGLGSILLEHAIRLARGQGCESMYLEVRPSNPAGYLLYSKNGFAVVGERPNYYRTREGRENAIVMMLGLQTD
jgi:ribosomal-protein-alanine N-acetyltransferase